MWATINVLMYPRSLMNKCRGGRVLSDPVHTHRWHHVSFIVFAVFANATIEKFYLLHLKLICKAQIINTIIIVWNKIKKKFNLKSMLASGTCNIHSPEAPTISANFFHTTFLRNISNERSYTQYDRIRQKPRRFFQTNHLEERKLWVGKWRNVTRHVRANYLDLSL